MRGGTSICLYVSAFACKFVFSCFTCPEAVVIVQKVTKKNFLKRQLPNSYANIPYEHGNSLKQNC